MSTEQFGDMRTEYSKALVAVGEEDPNVVVLGAAVSYTHLTLPTICSV